MILSFVNICKVLRDLANVIFDPSIKTQWHTQQQKNTKNQNLNREENLKCVQGGIRLFNPQNAKKADFKITSAKKSQSKLIS